MMTQLSDITIKAIKRFFNSTLVAYVAFQLIKTGIYSLPEDVLFFVTSDAVENFICVSIVFALYYYVIGLKNFWKKTGFILTFVVLLITLASLKEYRIYSTNSFEKTFEFFKSFLGQSLLFYLLLYFVNQLDTLKKYKKLEKELQQAKEQLLRNQLHPHFLYNAFNSLYSLSLKNHPETPDYILKLSGMMRYVTDETHPKKVSLTKEIDFIKKYIDIEKIRFGKDANIKLTIIGDELKERLIEPFLLITLVENAFKHGFYTNAKNAYVHMQLYLNDNELVFYVENSLFKKQHFQETARKGKGLEILKKRLKLLYSKKASLKTKTQEGIFITELKIIE